MKRKRKKNNGSRPIVLGALLLVAFLVFGYSKKFREIELAQATNITFEEENIVANAPSGSTSQGTTSDSEPQTAEGATKLTWKDLEGLDYLTGKMSARIKGLNNQVVKIPGYIVPLTDDLESFNEFLIVPDPQACIHFPPPPPNQILYVKTKKNLPINITFYPFWFQGRLEAVSTFSEFGKVSYRLTLQRLEAF
jgi:uncharacterized protein